MSDIVKSAQEALSFIQSRPPLTHTTLHFSDGTKVTYFPAPELEERVEAAAQSLYEATVPAQWSKATPTVQASWKKIVRESVIAAFPEFYDGRAGVEAVVEPPHKRPTREEQLRANFGVDPMTIEPDSFGHRTRFSDSSLYDEKCVLCGATDGSGDRGLNFPCPEARDS